MKSKSYVFVYEFEKASKYDSFLGFTKAKLS